MRQYPRKAVIIENECKENCPSIELKLKLFHIVEFSCTLNEMTMKCMKNYNAVFMFILCSYKIDFLKLKKKVVVSVVCV